MLETSQNFSALKWCSKQLLFYYFDSLMYIFLKLLQHVQLVNLLPRLVNLPFLYASHQWVYWQEINENSINVSRQSLNFYNFQCLLAHLEIIFWQFLVLMKLQIQFLFVKFSILNIEHLDLCILIHNHH